MNWTAIISGPCVVESGMELETDLLLGSLTLPFAAPGHLIHIRSEPMVATPLADPGNVGITQVFGASGGLHTRVLSSLWVYVVRGQAGMGAGPSGTSFALTSHSTVKGTWEHLVSVNAAVPAVQFNIYSTDSKGSEFYADNAVVCPADTDAELAACRLFVGDTGGGGAQTGNIASLTITPSTVTGGQSATGTIVFSSPAGAGGVQASLSSNNSAAGVPPSVTVPEGQTTASFPVTTTPVSSTTNATITATSANTVSAGLTINPSGGGQPTGTITGLTISPPSVTGGDSATGTVTLSAPAPAGGIPVSLSSNNSAAGVQPSVTVAEGQTTASFPVTTTPVSSTTTATITATSANSASAPLTINPSAKPCVGSLTFSTNNVIGGQSLQGIVTLTANAGNGGQIVNLSRSSALVQVPLTVNVAAGQNQATFNIGTQPVVSLVTPVITANANACAAVSGSFKLLP
ncbi:MAG: hypothetical protein HY248_05920 [Fimbriimonas ginsengisoli]|nr:hypothetical protein [Fimbriimonas ginsengisoli]